MKRLLLQLSTFFFSLSLFGQDVALGLKFTPIEQLQGIPIASTPFAGQELPRKVDLTDRMPPAGDQGQQRSCVAWAVAYACKSYQEQQEENNSYWSGSTLNRNSVFSPAFIYNQINNGVDGGSLFTDALNVLSQQGAVKWSDMPYFEKDYLTRPTSHQKNNANKYKIDFWRRVNYYDIKEVKAQINAGFPVIIGAMIDRGFVNSGNNSGGKDFVWDSPAGEELGGHAMLVVGYDDDRHAVKVLNSWGQNWGNMGYCWISYSFFPKAIREAYVMKDAINGPENNPQLKPVINPTSDLIANFQIDNVQHNLQDNQFGLVMSFTGMVDLPQKIGKEVQIVIRFYLNDGRNGKGVPVGSLSSYFMMPDGSAACGTPKSIIVPGNQKWFAKMPYQSLNIQKGNYIYGRYQTKTTYLVAEPSLFVDDFAVKTGQIIPFFVTL